MSGEEEARMSANVEDDDSKDDYDTEELPVRRSVTHWEYKSECAKGIQHYSFHMSLVANDECESASYISAKVKYHEQGGREDATTERNKKATKTSAGSFPGQISKKKTTKKPVEVGRLSGHLLGRPNLSFHSDADAITEELQRLAWAFFNSDGTVCRVDHPELNGIARSEGGFLHIEKVEVAGGIHRGIDLGLRLVHEVMVFMKTQWTIAVMFVGPMGPFCCHYSENKKRGPIRSAHDEPTPEDMEQHDVDSVKIQRHFARLGFSQADRTESMSQNWFVTNDNYFGQASSPSSVPDSWLAKDEAASIDVFVPPTLHVPTGLDKELKEALENIVAKVSYNESDLQFGPTPTPKPSNPLSHEDRMRLAKLVEKGASIDGARAMHVAAGGCKTSALPKALIELGGNINLQDENGVTPLHVAASHNKRLVPTLIQLGADKNICDKEGETPLDSMLEAMQSMQDFAACFGLGTRAAEVEDIRRAQAALM